jgi:hypothetical protein
MIEYAKCIYYTWSKHIPKEDIKSRQEEYILLCSKLLNRTPDEVRQRMQYYIDQDE